MLLFQTKTDRNTSYMTFQNSSKLILQIILLQFYLSGVPPEIYKHLSVPWSRAVPINRMYS
jgi:hypothetical protein